MKMFIKWSRHFLNFKRLYTPRIKNSGLIPFSQEDSAEFMNYFPLVVKDLTESNELSDVEDITVRFGDLLNYVVPNGKRVRGLTTVISYKYLEKPENLTPDNLKLANMLGWSTELIEGAITIYDDIMDNSTTRRNNICWHQKEGPVALTDARALSIACYHLIKKYLSLHPFYVQICDFSHKIYFNTSLGQSLDSCRYQPKDISMKTFKTISKYKTGYYTFYYPTILGMYLSKTYNKDLYDELAPILIDLGEFFQINNDINDCFGKNSITGKHGSDIEESKCTWLAVKALEKCSKSQKEFFERHYGKSEKEDVEKIKQLYLEFNLLDDYQKYQTEFFTSLSNKVNTLRSPQKELLEVLIENVIQMQERQKYTTI